MASPLKFLWLSVAAFVLLGASAHAAFWRCELPGGVYLVNLSSLASVSIHEYVVDAAARVTELTVATNSAVVARFYYIEPMIRKSPVGFGQSLNDKAQEREEASNRTGMEVVWKKVVKNYPLTTHAHTVEYRVESVDQLKKLEKSLEDAVRLNKDTQIKISEG
jgi:hypothetical protein